MFVVSCVVKRRPKLKSRYRKRVEAAIEYAKTIDDFDDLVDPRTLALHYLGPEPFSYVLRTIEIEEKKSKYLLNSSLSFPFSVFFPFFYFYFYFFNKCFPFAEMTTKFNQAMYAKMRVKKNEPFSNLENMVVHVVEKGVSVTLATPVTESMRIASSATFVEEIIPRLKKQRVADKGEDKADSCSSSIWDDAGLALMRA